jgi:hemin uptake protein HemP
MGSSTEPKSWRHLSIITPDAEYPPPEFPDQLNGRDKAAISHHLEELALKMTQLLRTFTDDEPGGSLPETISRLSAITAGWPKEMWASRLTLKTNTAFDEECLSLFAAEDEEDDEAETTVLQPSRKVVPLDVVGGDVTFEGALMRLTEAKDGHLLLLTEHRNYPFIFRLAAPMSGGESKLDLWFDVDKSNIPQALMFRELVEGITSSKQAALTCPSGEFARITL